MFAGRLTRVVARRALVRNRRARPLSSRPIPDKPVPYPPPPPHKSEVTTGAIRGAAAADTTAGALEKQEKAFAFSPAKNAAVALGLCGFVMGVYYWTIAAISTGSREELGDEWDIKNEPEAK